ncbi:MFS transporter [Amycolatopsis sp. NBC_01286]|uniref:MFS transporter n=1 Tax=Amycolatopsis sp. NBC_01286 TaxID=2903560 RepID=UPI002E0EDFA7|nr:MFS transporter [Amycolatopsis sp. NBC_01286]
MTQLVPLRRNTTFQLLWAGSAISSVGTELTRLATPLLVLATTGSAVLAAVVAGTRSAAALLAQIPAGVWVDRWDRRRTLVTSQAVQAGTAAVLAVAVLGGEKWIWAFVPLAVVDGICSCFVGPVRTTAIGSVVPPPQLRQAFAQEEARSLAARLVGPPLGGLLYSFGRTIPFLVDAVTFLAATICAVLAKVPRRPVLTSEPSSASSAEEARKPSMRAELGEAFTWIWRQRGLRNITGAVLILNLIGGAFLLPVIVLVQERGGSDVATGIVLAGIGIGGLVGAIAAPRTGNILPPGKLLLAVLGTFGACLATMALPLGPWWPTVPLICLSLATPALNVVMGAVFVQLVPKEMLGRMDAVLTVCERSLAPLGPPLGGFLAAAIGGANALIILGCVLVLTAVVAALSRELRDFTGDDRPVDAPGEAAEHS